MRIDQDRGFLELIRGNWTWGMLAVVVFLAIAWGGPWALNCVGSRGQLEFKEHGLLGKGSSYGHGYSMGLMWLTQGQRVMVNYQPNLRGDSEGAKIYLCFGPVEDWAMTWLDAKLLSSTTSTSDVLRGNLRDRSIRLGPGDGSQDFVAQKTGFHSLYYFVYVSGFEFYGPAWGKAGPEAKVNGDFTITWQVL